MRTIELSYRGYKLEVTYSVQPAEPELGIKEHIDEVSKIVMDGYNLYELLEPQISEIEEAIISTEKAQKQVKNNAVLPFVSGSAIDKMKKDFLKQAANDLTA